MFLELLFAVQNDGVRGVGRFLRHNYTIRNEMILSLSVEVVGLQQLEADPCRAMRMPCVEAWIRIGRHMHARRR